MKGLVKRRVSCGDSSNVCNCCRSNSLQRSLELNRVLYQLQNPPVVFVTPRMTQKYNFHSGSRGSMGVGSSPALQPHPGPCLLPSQSCPFLTPQQLPLRDLRTGLSSCTLLPYFPTALLQLPQKNLKMHPRLEETLSYTLP